MLTQNVWRQVLAQMNHVNGCKCDGCMVVRSMAAGNHAVVDGFRLAELERNAARFRWLESLPYCVNKGAWELKVLVGSGTLASCIDAAIESGL